jgi:hypothetical protein
MDDVQHSSGGRGQFQLAQGGANTYSALFSSPSSEGFFHLLKAIPKYLRMIFNNSELADLSFTLLLGSGKRSTLKTTLDIRKRIIIINIRGE